MAFMLIVAAATAFNLECAGVATESRGAFLRHEVLKTEPVTRTLRVDLSAGRWCQGECPTTVPIVEVEDAVVTFLKKDNSVGGLTVDEEMVVHRESGRFVYRRRFGDIVKDMSVRMEEGQCRRAPFTGFPTKVF